MDVSHLRQAILHALDNARRDAVRRREEHDQAGAAYRVFLDQVAGPLLKQAANVLRAEGHLFTLHTPPDTLRLVSDSQSETFLEVWLDRSRARPVVSARVSLARGRHGNVVEEDAIGGGKAVAELTEDDVAQFLVRAIPKMVVKP